MISPWTPFAVRLPMVLLLLFALFTMFWSMDRIFGHRVALSAVIVAATSFVLLAGRQAVTDMRFAMVSAALFALMGYLFGDEADAEAQEASVDAPAVWVLAALVGVLVELLTGTLMPSVHSGWRLLLLLITTLAAAENAADSPTGSSRAAVGAG